MSTTRKTTTRKTTASKSAPKKATPRKATPTKPAPTKPEPTVHGMTTAQRKAAATKIAKLRDQGIAWDTPETGVCAQVGIRTALIGRALLREFGNGGMIAPLTGTRAKS
jgi:hypothetical protein